MKSLSAKKSLFFRVVLSALIFVLACVPAQALVTELSTESLEPSVASSKSDRVHELLDSMSLDDKISQMIIPAIRTWNGSNVTDLESAYGLSQALQAHKYGGIILYGANIVDIEQTVRLTSSLQVNNAAVSDIPYFMCVDGEGGVVTRLNMGTRMNGNMALGAIGESAELYAYNTGKVIGEEVAAAGFNVDFAPDIDVNSNPDNPVIGTRSFSDDPQLVGVLGDAFNKGLSAANVIGSYKHFPGHGDTGTDSHINVSAVYKTLEELEETELVPFRYAISQGADMIMTAHVTLPMVDDDVVFGDGTTGCYPATMSKKILTEILRNSLSYNGVIVTDALEMGALYQTQLVEGDPKTVEYCANLAIKVIEAGADILLLPVDMTSENIANMYDQYIYQLAAYAEANPAFMERIDESVVRILELKEKYGILDMNTTGAALEEKVAEAQAIIGSQEHRELETEIAQKAVTVVKNDNFALPFAGHNSNIVIFGRDVEHVMTIEYAIEQMKQEGLISEDTYVVNLADGTTSGAPGSDEKITIGFYRDYPADGGAVVSYTDEMKAAVSEADRVVVFTVNYGLSSMQPSSDQYQGASEILADAKTAGAATVVLSCNLPYDVARYQDADALVCCYLSAGLYSDPTDDGELVAYNANVVQALEMMFDAFAPSGTLPVNVMALAEAEDGTVSYSDKVLYKRGSGLYAFNYAFLEGADASYTLGSNQSLFFKTNARSDKLTAVFVEGTDVLHVYESACKIGDGWTTVELAGECFEQLEPGEHVLFLAYDYDGRRFVVSTSFYVIEGEEKTPGTDVVPDDDPKPIVVPGGSSDSDAVPGGSSGSDAVPGGAAPAAAGGAGGATPATGDTTAALPMAALAVAGACAAAVALVAKKRLSEH